MADGPVVSTLREVAQVTRDVVIWLLADYKAPPGPTFVAQDSKAAEKNADCTHKQVSVAGMRTALYKQFTLASILLGS